MAEMTATIEISKEAQAWRDNFEMLKSLDSGSSQSIMDLRNKAMQSFVALGFPTTKHEEWKYTSLRNLLAGNWQPAFRPTVFTPESDKAGFYAKVLPQGFEGHVAVVVNGHFDAALSDLEGCDFAVESLANAIRTENPILGNYGEIAQYEGRATVALNTAIAGDGVLVHLKKKSNPSTPLYIVHLAVGENVAINSRSFFVADDFSEGKIVEIWHNWSGKSAWANHVTEIQLGVNANLDCHLVQNALGKEFNLLSFTQVNQKSASTFRSNVMSAEGAIVRNDLQVLHQGENCQTFMNGLTLLSGNSHVDNHTLVDHALPNCYSNETYKTVLDGQSTCVFNGKVMVRPDAQKTNAFQSNKTLLLSEGATVNTKPQLEIFADDVKCSHGATTGQLDETALFYLRSRGLSKEKAKALLTYAFGAEVLEQITIPELRESLESYLLARLQQN